MYYNLSIDRRLSCVSGSGPRPGLLDGQGCVSVRAWPNTQRADRPAAGQGGGPAEPGVLVPFDGGKRNDGNRVDRLRAIHRDVNRQEDASLRRGGTVKLAKRSARRVHLQRLRGDRAGGDAVGDIRLPNEHKIFLRGPSFCC